MHRATEDMPQQQSFATLRAATDVLGKRGRRPHACIRKALAERDRVAAGAQVHDGDERFEEPISAEVTEQRHAEQRVRGVELAERQPVTDAAPPELALQADAEPLVGEETAVMRDDQGRSVDQIEKADSKRESAGRGSADGRSGNWHGHNPFASPRAHLPELKGRS